jgi:exonuclease III
MQDYFCPFLLTFFLFIVIRKLLITANSENRNTQTAPDHEMLVSHNLKSRPKSRYINCFLKINNRSKIINLDRPTACSAILSYINQERQFIIYEGKILRDNDLRLIEQDQTFHVYTRIRGGSPHNINLAFQNIQSIHLSNSKKLAIERYVSEKNVHLFGIAEHQTTETTLSRWIRHSPLLSDSHTIITDHIDPTHNYNGNGVAVIIHKALHSCVTSSDIIPGRFIGLLLKSQHKHLYIATIYSYSNIYDPGYNLFANEILTVIDGLPPDTQIVLMGDWNDTINERIDRALFLGNEELPRPSFSRPSKLLSSLNNPYGKYQLLDIYRILNPIVRGFTNFMNTTKGRTTASRIDMFLISDTLLPYVSQLNTMQRNQFDPNTSHSLITLGIIFLADPLSSRIVKNRITRVLFKDATNEQILTYNTRLEQEINVYLADHPQARINMLENNTIDQLTNAIVTISQKTLPISTPEIRTGNRQKQNRIAKTVTKLSRYTNQRQFSLGELSQINKLYQKWCDPARLLTPQAMSLQTLEAIEKFLRQRHFQLIQDKIAFIDHHFATDTKRILDSILDRKQNFSGITFLKDGDYLTSSPQRILQLTYSHFSTQTGHGQPLHVHKHGMERILPSSHKTTPNRQKAFA